MSFWYAALPAEGQQLQLYVDGTLYKTYGQSVNGNFQQIILVLPGSQTASQKHKYRWAVTTEKAGQPAYGIDAIRCEDVAIKANAGGLFDFEEGFVPPEVTTNFVIDNTRSQGSGMLSAHPPLLPDAGSAELVVSCVDKSHTRMSFWYAALPTEGQDLRLYVDETLDPASYGQSVNGNFVQIEVAIADSGKEHRYRWVVTTATAGQPAYWIDGIRCQ